MTATSSRQLVAVSEWAKIFSENVTNNYTNSLTFMKQLTVIAVSTITYMKNAFPDDNYTTESFVGLKLRILKKTCRDEHAQFLSSSLQQAFEAFDKKYLEQLVLCFYEGECCLENLVEYHIFKYEYKSGGATLNLHSKGKDSEARNATFTFDHVKERTTHLIRTCVVIMHSAQNLSSDVHNISIRLYYNEDAPEGYQAPGYTSAAEPVDHLEPTLSETLKMGWVETPFHKVIARSFIKDSMKASNEANPSQNVPILSNEMELSGSVIRSTAESGFCCPCQKYDDVDAACTSDLLTCQYCKLQQHAVCFGVPRGAVGAIGSGAGEGAAGAGEGAAGAGKGAAGAGGHCCALCYDADPTRTPTDAFLVSLTSRKRESLCIFRRTLALCSEVPAVGARDLMQRFDISESSASKLIRLLFSSGIIEKEPRSKLTRQKIIPDKLQQVMAEHFRSGQDKLVDRIITQTFASQESVSDPISEVLNPLEQIHLQNASNIARYVDKPIENRQNNDETLREYREAISPEEKENLPVIKRVGKRTMGDDSSRTTSQSDPRTKRSRTMPK